MRKHTFALTLLAAGSLAACQNAGDDLSVKRFIGGSTRQVTDVQPVGGFLPAPSLLQPGGSGRAALMYRNPRVNFADYHALILDPVVVYTSPDSAFAKMPASTRQALANDFTSRLTNKLQGHCPLTGQPGPGVVRLRFALVGAKESDAVADTIGTYAPYVSAAYSVGSYAVNKGVAFFAGSATIEFYATDTVNKTVLWQAVDKRAGQTALVQNTLNTQLDIEHAFDAWADTLLTRLRQLGLCTG